MSHTIELSDEQYATLSRAAAVAEAAEALRDRMLEPRYFETDEWLRHLGVSDEEIEASNRRVQERWAREDIFCTSISKFAARTRQLGSEGFE